MWLWLEKKYRRRRIHGHQVHGIRQFKSDMQAIWGENRIWIVLAFPNRKPRNTFHITIQQREPAGRNGGAAVFEQQTLPGHRNEAQIAGRPLPGIPRFPVQQRTPAVFTTMTATIVEERQPASAPAIPMSIQPIQIRPSCQVCQTVAFNAPGFGIQYETAVGSVDADVLPLLPNPALEEVRRRGPRCTRHPGRASAWTSASVRPWARQSPWP